ncbi:MAG: hypothetical protein V1720_14685 [bacterium]
MKKYIWYFVIIFAVYGCKSGNEEGDTNADYSKVDSSKISIQFDSDDLGLSFNPPKNWEPIPNFRSAERKLKFRAQGSEEFISKPVYAFMDSKNKSNMTVTKIMFTGDVNKFKDFIGVYIQLQKLNLRNSKVTEGKNSIANREIRYLTIEKENLISKKFILLNNRSEIIQFDYTIPANDFQKNERFISSSIATLKFH